MTRKAAALVLTLGVTGAVAWGLLRRYEHRLAWHGTSYRTVGGAPACITASRYREFQRHSIAGDAPMRLAMIAQGVCVLLRPGIEVQPIHWIGAWLDGGRLVQVRVAGTRQTMVLDPALALEKLR